MNNILKLKVLNSANGVFLKEGDYLQFRINNGNGYTKIFRVYWEDEVHVSQYLEDKEGRILINGFSFILPHQSAEAVSNRLRYMSDGDFFYISLDKTTNELTIRMQNVDVFFFENFETNAPHVISYEYNTYDPNANLFLLIQTIFNDYNKDKVKVKFGTTHDGYTIIHNNTNQGKDEISLHKNKEHNLTLLSVEEFTYGNPRLDVTVITPSILSSLFIDIEDNEDNFLINYLDVSKFFWQDLEYSIDGINFQTSNVFPKQEGEVTVFIRDAFSGEANKTFVLQEKKVKPPYFFVSKANPIRFALRDNNHLTDENTLSNESTSDVAYKDLQRFKLSDKPTTQIRSNYNNITARVITSGQSHNLEVNKVLNLIDEKDYRDCVIYSSPNNKTALYFDIGKVYDYETSEEVEDFVLRGKLPFWYRKDLKITIDALGDFIINRVFFDENINAYAVELSSDYSGEPFFSKVKSTYDIKPYNVFEFTADFSSFYNQNIRIEVKAEDEDYNTINLLSEEIVIKDNFKKCLEIIYYDKDRANNSEILYQTEVENILNVPYRNITDASVSETKIQKGDNTVYSLNSEFHEADLIEFMPLSKELAKKLQLALFHSFLQINGQQYVLAENPTQEIEGNSNLYIVKAKLIKNSIGLNAELSNIFSTQGSIEVPNLLNLNTNGFLVI